MDSSLVPPNPLLPGMPSTTLTMDDYPMDYTDASNYEVFDPLNWMLDGLVDLPYNLNALQGLEQPGIGANGLNGDMQ